MASIRQNVTVKPGGLIEVRSPELKEGEQAEVIVLLDKQPASIACRLAALDQLQKSLNLDHAMADAWIRAARQERETLGSRE